MVSSHSQSSADVGLLVEIATGGLDSKKNKELGTKITSKCPLEGCPSPSPHHRLQPLFSSIINNVFPM